MFCTAPWTHTYISPRVKDVCVVLVRRSNDAKKQYIDASNDESTGMFRPVGTIADYKPVTLKKKKKKKKKRTLNIGTRLT